MARVHAPFFKFTSLFSNLKLQLLNPWVRSQPSFPRRSSGIKSSMRSSPQRSRWAAEPGRDVLDASDVSLKKSDFRSFSMIIRSFSFQMKPTFHETLQNWDFYVFSQKIPWLFWCSAWPVDQVYLLAMAMLSFVPRCNKNLGSWFMIFFPSNKSINWSSSLINLINRWPNFIDRWPNFQIYQ